MLSREPRNERQHHGIDHILSISVYHICCVRLYLTLLISSLVYLSIYKPPPIFPSGPDMMPCSIPPSPLIHAVIPRVSQVPAKVNYKLFSGTRTTVFSFSIPAFGSTTISISMSIITKACVFTSTRLLSCLLR